MIHYPNSTHDPYSYSKYIKYDTSYETSNNVPHDDDGQQYSKEPC
jgi:hypothetical protein